MDDVMASNTSLPSTTPSTLEIVPIVIPILIALACIALFAFLLMVVLIVYMCCCIRKQPIARATNSNTVPLQGYIPPSKPEEPATSGKYTGLYCDSKHRVSGRILKNKHGDLIKLLSNADEINAARPDTNCSDIIIFSDITNNVVKEVISSGDPTHHDKVKIIQFVTEDRMPDNTLEIEGYKVVQVVGSPDNEDDVLFTVLNKAEYPVAKSSMIDGGIDENTDRNSVFSNNSPFLGTHDATVFAPPDQLGISLLTHSHTYSGDVGQV